MRGVLGGDIATLCRGGLLDGWHPLLVAVIDLELDIQEEEARDIRLQRRSKVPVCLSFAPWVLASVSRLLLVGTVEPVASPSQPVTDASVRDVLSSMASLDS